MEGFTRVPLPTPWSDLNLLAAYAKDRVRRLAETIRTGHIDIAPYRKLNSGERACRYCRYDAVCRFELGYGAAVIDTSRKCRMMKS